MIIDIWEMYGTNIYGTKYNKIVKKYGAAGAERHAPCRKNILLLTARHGKACAVPGACAVPRRIAISALD